MSLETSTGSRIERTRNHLSLSHRQLADRVGVDRRTLETWERDEGEPRGVQLLKLAGVLQVPMIWLLTGDAPEEEARVSLPETVRLSQKLDRAVAMQRDLAVLLAEITGEVARLQRELDDIGKLAA